MLEPGDAIPGARIVGASGAPWKRRYYLSSDEPLRDFTRFTDEFVEEMMRINGRGDIAGLPCPTCPEGHPDHPPTFRCTSCCGLSLYCQACMVELHMKRPFCQVEEWREDPGFGCGSFHRVSLRSLGVTIQLGHPDGQPCAHATLASKDFVVMDIGGIHHSAVYYCGCAGAAAPRQQLFRHRLFPATVNSPRTACTFALLDHFVLLTSHGKVTMYDYYNALERMTDSIGISGVKDRYKAFARSSREWRVLTNLKRGGRGNDNERKPSDVRPGELAVVCPACPRPGENLPPDWASVPRDKEYLYYMPIALDACFRLKRRAVSSAAKDPRLIDGGGYIVEQKPFDAYIKTAARQDDTTSSCSGLSAIEHANTKYAKGYAETGKGIGVCARHEFVQPNGVVPLQAGERYANMDYVLASILKGRSPLLKVILSYDIACQFSKNLVERIKLLPPLLRFEPIARTMRFVIPKLHIHGHKLWCQLFFSFLYLFGGARTDGEGVERPWAHLGPLGTSLRQMGPGSAADTLEDHLGHWNWLKLVGLGRYLLRKLLEALKEEAIQRAELAEFSREQASHVAEWKDMVLAFECDNSKPNPFEMPHCGISEEDVQLDLAQEAARAAETNTESLHEMTPGDFVVLTLETEEQQRSLAYDVATKEYNTPKQKTELFRLRAKISRAINKMHDAQKVYCPTAAARLEVWAADPANIDTPVERRPLFPPSSLSQEERAVLPCDVAAIEIRLRDAQCRVGLNAVRTHLLAKARELRFKNSNIRHQGSTTRARNILKGIDDKVRASADKYVIARDALVRLANSEASDVRWRKLDVHKDLRCMEEREDTRRQGAAQEDEAAAASTSHLQRMRDATGEGRRTVSWIWYGSETVSSDAEGTELYEDGGLHLAGVRVEWCKAYARLRRWQEQILLLREEMRRTLVSLDYRAQVWKTRGTSEKRDGPLGEGSRAYAARQYRVYTLLTAHFRALWIKAPSTANVNVEEAARLQAELDADEAATVVECNDEDAAALDEGDEDDSDEDDE
ncbi:hypothetical protein BD626DRAFT_549440 [Schizophyllum amplum]|uniref:CxC2-like cysteine cluster KDZ transposase-associated domain-containing protein n=1 Tax=Schizophyllum amplum TaxID=97359 RepID=A0A550C797_9AGAR|nr:hypothetical protein BD626DRAFT_549440 [Auriculariopsis ampla]